MDLAMKIWAVPLCFGFKAMSSIRSMSVSELIYISSQQIPASLSFSDQVGLFRDKYSNVESIQSGEICIKLKNIGNIFSFTFSTSKKNVKTKYKKRLFNNPLKSQKL